MTPKQLPLACNSRSQDRQQDVSAAQGVVTARVLGSFAVERQIRWMVALPPTRSLRAETYPMETCNQMQAHGGLAAVFLSTSSPQRDELFDLIKTCR